MMFSMPDTELFFSSNPAAPWSYYPLGLPALALVALGLVLLTLWTYLGHKQASRRRIVFILGLRLTALFVVLLTAVRPTVGVQEDPKIPSAILIGVDMSASMEVTDELGTGDDRMRIKAVRKVLDKCEPTIEELKNEQNVNVVIYGFGPTEFTDASNRYDPKALAHYNRSDYGTYLNRSFERWQTERFVRAHLIIGDGQDNGSTFNPLSEAERWRRAGRPVHTFAVGKTDTDAGSKDVALTAASVTSGNPDGSVFVKTEFTMKVIANAAGFTNTKLPLRVFFDVDGTGYVQVFALNDLILVNEKDNEFELKLTAPDKPCEMKVKIEIPHDRTPGDVNPTNNVLETYVKVTKEGMRILIVNRLGYEHAALRRALQADPRINLYQVIRQTEDPATASEREDFDFDKRLYDVIIIGNVSAKQLTTLDRDLPAKIAKQVKERGVGLLMTGGHATFTGTPNIPDASGWRGTKDIEDILPVDLNQAPPVAEKVFTDDANRFQLLPTFETRDHYLTRLGNSPTESADQWKKLNDFVNRSRFTGLSKVGTAKPTATVYAVASESRGNLPVPTLAGENRKLAPLLVGHQIGADARGRVLVLAAQDTYLWQKLGQPDTNDGLQLHARFWRQLVRWLAHQEEDDSAAFAKPDLRRLPIGAKQTIRVGLRAPGGIPAKDPKFEIKILAPGEDETAAKTLTPIPDPDGGFKLPYEPAVAGEYAVKLSATGTDAEGKEVKGEASARFLTYPESTEEKDKKAANHIFLQQVATAGGGTYQALEELPAFLKKLKSEPIETVKPKPKYRPDWRRNHSQGFLPIWLIVFVILLGTEWGLRRWWGLV